MENDTLSMVTTMTGSKYFVEGKHVYRLRSEHNDVNINGMLLLTPELGRSMVIVGSKKDGSDSFTTSVVKDILPLTSRS